jgi:hypothetical protein
LNRHITEEDAYAANKHSQRGFTSLFIRETQIQRPVRYHSMPSRMAKLNTDNKKCRRRCGTTRSQSMTRENAK